MDFKNNFINNKPYLLVDSSYVTFYRFFSTLIWYTNTFPEKVIPHDYEWVDDEIFLDKYNKNYITSIDKIRTKYKIPYSNIIIVRDCPREFIWRNNIYPEYKSTRKNTCTYKNKKFNIGNIFKHVYSNLYPKLIEKYNMSIIKVDNAEADDIIAILARKIHELDEKRLVVIITNDNDYLQLVNNKLLIWSLQNKLLNVKVELKTDQLLLKKILKGDESDNIPPCLPNVSEEHLEYLVTNKKELDIILNNSEEIKKKFELNRNLIDFNYIPDNIKNEVITNCKDFLEKVN